MRVNILWWDLNESKQTIESLREYLRDESVEAFAQVPGLRLKTWISDADANRWGAVLLWESREAAAGPTPSRAAEVIGFAPTQRFEFDVEATVEGRFDDATLSGLGLAFLASEPSA